MDNQRKELAKKYSNCRQDYLSAFDSRCSELGVDPAALVKNSLSYADLMGLVPGGGVIEGITVPETGASRGETMLYGGGGSILGALLGGGLGAGLTADVTGTPGNEQLMANPVAALAGASLGSGAGNLLGRWLARRKGEPATSEELQAMLAQLQGKSGITINMPGTGPNTELGATDE